MSKLMRLFTGGLLALVGVLCLSNVVSAQQPVQKKKEVEKKNASSLPEGTTVERDLSYGPHERNKLDMYVPKGEGPFPLVIWIHGGAWAAGSKAGGGPAIRLLEHGYATAAINYRFSQHAPFPAQIEDCKAAIRFLRANAKKYHINPERVGVWGSSAGGHLVALLGVSGDVKDWDNAGQVKEGSSKVQAVVDYFGPTDLTMMGAQSTTNSKIDHDAANSPESRLIGGALPKNKEKAAKASPITYVSKNAVPILIFHGDADPLVPVQQSRTFHEALQKAGADSTYVEVKGAGHGNGIGTAEHFKRVVEFFDKHLKQ